MQWTRLGQRRFFAWLALTIGLATTQSPDAVAQLSGLTRIEFPSANPAGFAEIIRGDTLPPIRLQGHFGKAAQATSAPLIVIVPGSGGLGGLHLRHAQTLRAAGFSVLAIDPYGARGIRETVSDQTRLSFAASAYDVLAAIRYARSELGVPPDRIGVVGFSRGGTAAMLAASRALSEAVLGRGNAIAAVLPAYPWCGVGFDKPDIGRTRLHVIIGDADDWVSPVQCQGMVRTMAAGGARASIVFYPGAVHGFDSGNPVARVEGAVKALGMPVVSINDGGYLIDWRDGIVKKDWNDRSIERLMQDGGFMAQGAQIGSRGDEARRFSDEMVAYFRSSFQR